MKQLELNSSGEMSLILIIGDELTFKDCQEVDKFTRISPVAW